MGGDAGREVKVSRIKYGSKEGRKVGGTQVGGNKKEAVTTQRTTERLIGMIPDGFSRASQERNEEDENG